MAISAVEPSSVTADNDPYYEDRITIATTLHKGRGRLLEFSYQATNQDGVLVAEGQTRHLVLDAERRLVSLPDKYQQLINQTAML